MVIEKEGFASRWSRRKQEVVNEATVEESPEDLEPVIDEETLAEQRLEKLNALTDEDMPDVETLNEDSDFSGFMSTSVSETLRKMALQKLFHGKSYNVRDGLDEYDGDYTSFEKLDPSVITCDMKHILEVEAEKLLAKEKEEQEEADRIAQEALEEEQLADVELDDETLDEAINENEELGEEMVEDMEMKGQIVNSDEEILLDKNELNNKNEDIA